MKENPNGFEPLALVWTLVGALNDAMNLRNLRQELYGESADLLPPRAADVHLFVPPQRFDHGIAHAERSVRPATRRFEIP
jgi:hypothetical protein